MASNTLVQRAPRVLFPHSQRTGKQHNTMCRVIREQPGGHDRGHDDISFNVKWLLTTVRAHNDLASSVATCEHKATCFYKWTKLAASRRGTCTSYLGRGGCREHSWVGKITYSTKANALAWGQERGTDVHVQLVGCTFSPSPTLSYSMLWYYVQLLRTCLRPIARDDR